MLFQNIGFLKKLNWISLINIFSSIRQKINKINDIIQKNSQASTIESVKKDKKIRDLFRYYRYRQPNCKNNSQFFIPGWFTSQSKRHTDKFDSGTSSSANVLIYKGVRDCLIYLKNIILFIFKKRIFVDSFAKLDTELIQILLAKSHNLQA